MFLQGKLFTNKEAAHSQWNRERRNSFSYSELFGIIFFAELRYHGDKHYIKTLDHFTSDKSYAESQANPGEKKISEIHIPQRDLKGHIVQLLA